MAGAAHTEADDILAVEQAVAKRRQLKLLVVERAERGNLGDVKSFLLDGELGARHGTGGLVILLDPATIAIDACTRAIELDPREATAWLYRGCARLDKGYAQGEDDIHQALTLDPALQSPVNLGGG